MTTLPSNRVISIRDNPIDHDAFIHQIPSYLAWTSINLTYFPGLPEDDDFYLQVQNLLAGNNFAITINFFERKGG